MQNNQTVTYHCPKCEGILTPWVVDGHVCDVCGYGKNSWEEYDQLQVTKRRESNV